MITPNGGVFGRNPKFNNVTVDGNLTVNGDIALGDDITITDTLTVNGVATFTGGATVRPNASAPTSNVVLGPSAGAGAIATTDNCVAIGNSALLNNVGDNNVAIGSSAGSGGNSATFSNNVAIGFQALRVNSAGNGNVAIGRLAAELTDSTSNVTAVGGLAMHNATNAENCVAVGGGSGRFRGAGTDTLTSATSSVFIGHQSRANGNSQTNQVVIAGTDGLGNGSNTTTIGNSSTTGTFIPAGNLTLSNGNLILGTAGKGIDFSADANAAGMTSELLDDYEEGTYTPNLEFYGANVSMTYTTQVGSYTKIGRMVHVTGHIVLSNKGTSTGHATITFPFTIANEASATGSFVVAVNEVTYGGSIMPALLINNTRGHLYDVSEAGVLGLITEADFGNTSSIRWTATYRV